MARIDMETLIRLEKERNTVHSKVQTTYSVFNMDDEKYVQLDTYGRPGRDMPEKISQSIQFDKDSAVFIVNLLIKEFDLKTNIS